MLVTSVRNLTPRERSRSIAIFAVLAWAGRFIWREGRRDIFRCFGGPIEKGMRANSAMDDEELIGLGLLLVLVLAGLVVVVVLLNYFAT